MSTHHDIPTTGPGQTRLQRWLLAIVGLLCVALGAVGVVVPGLPTTVFVLIASYCFTRSCPWLEERLLRNRLFARAMRYADGKETFGTAQRLVVMAIIVLFTATSVILLRTSGMAWLWLSLIILFGAVGVVAVALWRRQSGRAAGADSHVAMR